MARDGLPPALTPTVGVACTRREQTDCPRTIPKDEPHVNDPKLTYAQVLRELASRFFHTSPGVMHPARARRILLDLWAHMCDTAPSAPALPAMIPLLLTMPTHTGSMTRGEVAAWLDRHLADLEGAAP